MKTSIYNQTQIERKWYIIDVKDQIMGRISTKISDILMGKNNPLYSPNIDAGDNVIVLNAKHVALTGSKAQNKTYFSHSTYAGGGKTKSFEQAIVKDPTFPITQAIKGMLPKNARGRHMLKKLFVYEGESHPHQAQQPEQIKL